MAPLVRWWDPIATTTTPRPPSPEGRLRSKPSPPGSDDLVRLALQALVGDSGLYVTVLDTAMRTAWISPAWLEFSARDAGVSPEESWAARVPPEYHEPVREGFRKAFEARAPVDLNYRIRRADGEMRDIQSHALPLLGPGGSFAGYVVTNTDVTELHAARSRLQLALHQQEHFFDSLDAIVTVMDRQYRYRFVNRGWERMFGRTRSQVLGRSVRELLPADLARQIETQLDQVFEQGGSVNTRMSFHDGGQARHMETRRTLVPDLDGRTMLACGIAIDVTAHHVQEQAEAEQNRRRAEQRRLESLGIMAGGIAHEFNNLFTAILGNMEMALMDLAPGAPARETVVQALAASQRAAGLAKQMLSYSGLEHAELAPVNAGRLLEALRPALAADLPPGTSLLLERSAELPEVLADAAQLEQAVHCLVRNAAESYGPGGGEVRVTVHEVRGDDARGGIRVEGSCESRGACVCIEVADAGAGMDADTVRRAFDPFFSTRFVGRGLGLPVVLGVVRAHGGGIEVDTRPGAGTTLRVLLHARDPGSAAGT
jgi:two-component system cell cycle sensor histidine kinase/response regulator CckA